MTVLTWILLGLFWLLLAVAAIGDVRTLRISNLLNLAVLVVATALWLVRPDAGPWWAHLASFALTLTIGFALFSAGVFGGGDAKFAAAAAILFDLGELLRFAIVTTLGGALVAIAVVLIRRKLRGQPVPYGVAIALGAALVSAQAIALR